MGLNDNLKKIDSYPFHMPGHKRNADFNISGSEIDITEIDGFDNLHSPNGIILDIENKLQEIYKAKKSFISVNGSSCCILASIFSLCNKGDKIIIARNCHKSVYNACQLLELKIAYIQPSFDATNGYYTRISQDELNRVYNKNKDAKAVVITSPTYEGYISGIECPIPLIIDAAHGAHLGISYFPKYPKGDIVISSLHKTLPSLTQTAVVNVYNDEYIGYVKRYIDIFQSTSPSYVLMNSIDICTDYVIENKNQFGLFYQKLCDLRLMDIHNLKIEFNDDISKIVISCSSCNISGIELAKILRDKYKIEVEMASQEYIVLMATIGDTDEGFSRLKDALEEIDEGLSPDVIKLIGQPIISKEINEIKYGSTSIALSLDECIGKLANEFVYAYPPDIPIITPNELISNEAINYIKSAIKSDVNLKSESGELPNKILTKAAI